MFYRHMTESEREYNKWLLISILFFPVFTVAGGYFFTLYWKWFIVSTFNLPELGLFQSCGIILMFAYLTHQSVPSKDKDPSRIQVAFTHCLVEITIMPLVALLFKALM